MIEIRSIIKFLLGQKVISLIVTWKARMISSFNNFKLTTTITFWSFFSKTVLLVVQKPRRLMPVEWQLHLLTCNKDFTDCCWAILSFLRSSKVSPEIKIHDDGTLSRSQRQYLSRKFPNVSIIGRSEADIKMKEKLHGYKNCLKYRFEIPRVHAIKLFDVYFYSQGKPFVFIDSDVLFFRYPEQLLDLVKDGCAFSMKDIQNAYALPIHQINDQESYRVEELVNTGIFSLGTSTEYSLTAIDRFLGFLFDSKEINLSWIEQTTFAHIFSMTSSFELLSSHYDISAVKFVGEKKKQAHKIDNSTNSFHFVNNGLRYQLQSVGIRKLVAGQILQ